MREGVGLREVPFTDGSFRGLGVGGDRQESGRRGDERKKRFSEQGASYTPARVSSRAGSVAFNVMTDSIPRMGGVQRDFPTPGVTPSHICDSVPAKESAMWN